MEAARCRLQEVPIKGLAAPATGAGASVAAIVALSTVAATTNGRIVPATASLRNDGCRSSRQLVPLDPVFPCTVRPDCILIAAVGSVVDTAADSAASFAGPAGPGEVDAPVKRPINVQY